MRSKATIFFICSIVTFFNNLFPIKEPATAETTEKKPN